MENRQRGTTLVRLHKLWVCFKNIRGAPKTFEWEFILDKIFTFVRGYTGNGEVVGVLRKSLRWEMMVEALTAMVWLS